MKWLIIFLILLISLIGNSSNTIYARGNRIIYVDNALTADCLNSNSKHYEPSLPRGSGCINGGGTEAYNTIQKAANVVIPGDTVLVRGGTYLANFQILRSGTATDRITFKNYQSEEPILDEEYIRGNCINLGGTGDLTLNQAQYVTIEGFTCKNILKSGLARGIRVSGTRGAIIKNNHVYQGGYSDLITNPQHLVIGIAIVGPNENVLVESNHVHHFGLGIDVRFASAFPTPPKNVVLRYNHIHHIGIDCIATDYADCLNDQNSAHALPIANGVINSIVEYNVIHHGQDGNLNTNENGPGVNTFKNNILYLSNHLGSPGANGYGLKFKPATAQVDNTDYALGNVIFDSKSTGLIANVFSGNGALVYNNLVYRSGGDGFTAQAYIDPRQVSLVKNNALALNVLDDLHYPSTIANSVINNYIEDGLGFNSIINPNNIVGITNPINNQFNNLGLLDVDSDSDKTPDILEALNYPDCTSTSCIMKGKDAYDYALAQLQNIFGLKSTSVLIDAGTIIPSYHCLNPGPDSSGCREWYGNAPDIGAFEYNSGSSVTTTSTSSTTSSSTRALSITTTTTSSTSTSTSALSCYDYSDLPSCVTSLCVNNQNVFIFDNSSCDDRDKCTTDVCTRIGCKYNINYTDSSCSTIDSGCKDKDDDGLYEHDSKNCPIGTDVCEEKKQDLSFDELNSLRPRSSILNIDFNGSDYREISDFRIFKEKIAEIKFKERLDLVSINESGCFISLNIDNLVEIKDKKVVIYSEDYSGFNKPALITFYKINFKDPKIKKDGVLCNEPDCKIISYDQTGKIFLVEVKGFSEYLVVEGSVSNDGGGSSSSFKNTKIIGQIACKENWSCSEFGECINGKQIRICSDENKCGTINNKPSEERNCYGKLIDNLFIKTENSEFNNLFSNDDKKISTGATILISFIIVDIILFLIVYFVLIKRREY